MFLAQLLLACCLAPQSVGSPGPAGPSAPAAAAPATPWRKVETLRLLLEQKLRDQLPAIGPSLPNLLDYYGTFDRSDPNQAGPTPPGGGSGAPDAPADPSVSSRFYGDVTNDFFLNSQAQAQVRSHGEFVPGLGAVLSVTMPVRCEYTPAGPAAPDERQPAKRSDDDAEWDAVASGQPRTTSAGNRTAFDALNQRIPSGTLTLSADALAALKKTAVETAWRFGAKLDLGRGEKLAIVVVAEPQASAQQRFGGWTVQNTNPQMLGDLPVVSRLFNYGMGMPPQLPPTKRLVILVSSEELKAYRAGDVEPHELASIATGDF